MLNLLVFTIRAVGSLDIDGDGNSEILIGTEKGLFLYQTILSEKLSYTLLDVPVRHISYDPENFRIIVVVEDPSSPIRILNLPNLKDSPLPITGNYRKVVYSNGKFYLLSEVALLRFDGSNLEVVEERIYDITTCGLRGEREVFAVGEKGILVIGYSKDRINVKGNFIACLGSKVLTSNGILRFRDGKFEFINVEDPDIFSVRPLGENFVSLASYMGRPYVIFGKDRILRIPTNSPTIFYTRPFHIFIDGSGILISDLSLHKSVSYGLLPIDPGIYWITMGGRSKDISFLDPTVYDLEEIFREDGILSVRSEREGVEISLQISEPSNVEVFILSLSGKVIKTVYRGHLRRNARFYWYGDTDNGENLKSGVYFVRANVNGYTITRRLVWSK